jgi:hypothetical protein
MHNCQKCASADVHWFTPRSVDTAAAIFLCRECGHLSIITGRSQLHLARSSSRLKARAA